jgi:hypothetical protein
MKWALAGSLALIACACTAPQKPFGRGQERSFPPECSEEPSGSHELTATKVERTFAVTIAGAAMRKQSVVVLRALHLSFAPYASCDPLRAKPPIEARMVARDGSVFIPPAPKIDVVLGPDLLDLTDIVATPEPDEWPFCYELPMHPGVTRVELFAGARTLLSLRRAAVEPRVLVDAVEPRIAISYQNEAADYALAQMHIETADGTCDHVDVVERSGTGFLGLGARCWSAWRGHFEHHNEIDRGMNHRQFYFASQPQPGYSRGGQPAALIVNDLFHRWTFPLPFRASCN